jgi:hypothetical protein
MVDNPHDMPVGIVGEKALLKAQSCTVENHRALARLRDYGIFATLQK